MEYWTELIFLTDQQINKSTISLFRCVYSFIISLNIRILVDHLMNHVTPLPFPQSLNGRKNGRSSTDAMIKSSRYVLMLYAKVLIHGAPLVRFAL